MNYLDIAFKITLSLILGLLIGLERARNKKAAGVKTHTLTCIGSTIFAISGVTFFYEYYNVYAGLNPMYIIGAVATGIGFIGAGSIIRSEKEARGLSAAASIWIMGAVGLAIGFGYYFLAIFSTIVIFLVLVIIEFIGEKRKRELQ